jgi:hypothetical protein
MSITIRNVCCSGKSISQVYLTGLVYSGPAIIANAPTDCTNIVLYGGSSGFYWDSGGGMDDQGNELPTIPLATASIDNCSQINFNITFLGQYSPYYGIGSGGPLISLQLPIAYEYNFSGSFVQPICVSRGSSTTTLRAKFKMGDSYSVYCLGVPSNPILYPPYTFVVSNPTLRIEIVYNNA